MTIGFVTMEKSENRPLNSVGSSRIRARWVAKYWHELYPEDTAEEYMVGKKYDVLVFQKTYFKDLTNLTEGIKIFDICDPDWLEPRPVMETIGMCDAATTSTNALADYIKKFIKDKPIVCIPDRIDLDVHIPRGPHSGQAKTIVWFGYGHNANYLIKTYDLIIEKDLELTYISDSPIPSQRGFERMKTRWVKYNYNSIHDELKKHDLALLPVTDDDLRGSFKSNNKVLTAWALGIPVVQTADDLDRLMSGEERERERVNKLSEIKENWDVRQSVREYKELINRIKVGNN